MRIVMKPQYVRKGQRGSPDRCPWALACRAALKPPRTSLVEAYPGVVVVRHEDGSQDQYRLPPLPSRQMVQHDAGMRFTINDFDFDPEEVVHFDSQPDEGQGVIRMRDDYRRLVT